MLQAYHNFSALSELSTGLRRESVQRLDATWALVPPAVAARFAALVALVSDKSNYRGYKEAVRALGPAGEPMVPHLGAHTAELTMQDQLLAAEVAGPDGETKLLHFRRQRELYKLTAPLLAMQSNSYDAHAAAAAAAGAGAAPPMPPRIPSLSAALEAAVRPFLFAFDEDREAAVSRLAARSAELEPTSSRDKERAPAADASGAIEDAASGAAGQRPAAVPASGGGLFARLFSPKRPQPATVADAPDPPG